jgi:hypothetical protein
MTMRTERLPFRHDVLLMCLLGYTAASVFHYSHNAEFLRDYPNLPAWLSRAQVYAAWVAVTAIGAIGYVLLRSRHERAGLGVLTLYGLLGLDGLTHYAVAPFSAHTMTMNFSIGLEAATALLLLAVVGYSMLRVTRAGVLLIALVAVSSGQLIAQDKKPVPKDSARVSIPGCTKGYTFTAMRRTVDEPGSVSVPDGTHFRMNGPKKLIGEIRAQEGSMVEITGITKKGQYLPGGVAIGGGMRVGPGSGSAGGSQVAGQLSIDVEGWRPLDGRCPSR